MSGVVDIHTGCSSGETTDDITTTIKNINGPCVQNDVCQTTTTPTTNESKDKSNDPTSHSTVGNRISDEAVRTTAVSTTTTETAMTKVMTMTQQWENRVQIVRQHFERKGYRVHSGLQFGCELVLYADDPSRVHSDFCVHVVPEGKYVIIK